MDGDSVDLDRDVVEDFFLQVLHNPFKVSTYVQREAGHAAADSGSVGYGTWYALCQQHVT